MILPADDSISERLVLGTVQLGIPYGVANRTGQPDFESAIDILATAWEGGIQQFDTAQGYGDSEAVLGYAFKKLGIQERVRVITKLDPNLDIDHPGDVEAAVNVSLKKIGVKCLWGVMLHREASLEHWDSGLGEGLKRCVSSGMVRNIGVSVYTPEKASLALNMDDISMVQIPSNILDQRFLKGGVFDLADRLDKNLYVRSIFLQGLILLEGLELPPEMYYAKAVIDTLGSMAKKYRLTRQALALGYAKSAYANAKIIFGAETTGQIDENLRLWTTFVPKEMVQEIAAMFQNMEDRILNPALWPANNSMHP